MPDAPVDPISPSVLAGRRVLVVDDHETKRRALVDQLAAWGMWSVEVAGGDAAIEALSATLATAPFDLVLLDLQTPGMDGEETAARITGDPRFAGVPIVLLSSADVHSMEEQLRAVLGRRVNEGAPRAAETPESDASPVFDPSLLELLCGGDPALRREVIDDFLAIVPDLMARIETSIASGDGPALLRASHSLKGSALTIGANGLGSACELLATFGHGQALDGARDALARAEQELTRLREALVANLSDASA